MAKMKDAAFLQVLCLVLEKDVLINTNHKVYNRCILRFQEISQPPLNKHLCDQIVLADETTKLLHGEGCLKEIHQTVKQVFAGGVGGSNAALPR